ncbi:nucleotidyltransferase family protein [Eubacterium sp. 1001713B170207_170306_E7]|uniref:nucleotidyltransferase domain-containing protein n=1 Tax=Eubacterium sp. 1001713B170207_170306_E7 TaxID=2787097 RepID=UPI001897140F|nr:nucleotidyltransferase family protein [Eubacterium sp. 1001713B170207_170306_E7]
MIRDEKRYVVELLAAVLKDRKPEPLEPGCDWEAIYKEARRHSVAGMADYGLEKLAEEEQPPQAVRQRFKQARLSGIAKEATQHVTVTGLLKDLDQRGIRALPLKGFVLKYAYPRPDMRLMADVDILVDDANTKAVKQILTGMGFSCEHEGGNHDVYYRRPYMNLEIHRNILPEKYSFGGYFDHIFDRAALKEGFQCVYAMTPEDFYLYMVAHLTKHYAQGGTGIRSVMDLWVYRRFYKETADWEAIGQGLETMGLKAFGDNLARLAEVWFDGPPGDAVTDEMGRFILGNGTYGTTQNMELSAFASVYDERERFSAIQRRYFWRTLFPGMDHMRMVFPWVEGRPVLLPAAWVMRGVRAMVKRPGRTLHRVRAVRSTSEQEVATAKGFYERSGLQEPEHEEKSRL